MKFMKLITAVKAISRRASANRRSQLPAAKAGMNPLTSGLKPSIRQQLKSGRRNATMKEGCDDHQAGQQPPRAQRARGGKRLASHDPELRNRRRH